MPDQMWIGLTPQRAEVRRGLLAARTDETSRSLCLLYELYLSHRGREERQLKKAMLSTARTLAVYAAVPVAWLMLGLDQWAVLVAGSVALGLNHGLDLLEAWVDALRTKGMAALLSAPRMVEILFSSQSRYPYWCYSSHAVLLSLCLVPLFFLFLSPMSPAQIAALTAAWGVTVFSKYLTPATPPFVVVSAGSTPASIDLVAKLSFRIFPLRVTSLLDYDRLRREQVGSFLQQKARYDAAKAHYLFRTRGDWKAVFLQLAELSDILVVDARQPLTELVRFEVTQIVQHDSLLKRTLFVVGDRQETSPFNQVDQRPAKAMLVGEADLEVLVWALARQKPAVPRCDGFIWHCQAIPGTASGARTAKSE
jgi:hypothetical protein